MALKQMTFNQEICKAPCYLHGEQLQQSQIARQATDKLVAGLPGQLGFITTQFQHNLLDL